MIELIYFNDINLNKYKIDDYTENVIIKIDK